MSELSFSLAPRVVARRLALVIVLFDLAFVASKTAHFAFGYPLERKIMLLVDLDDETNLPSLFSAGLIAAAAAAVAVTASFEKGRGRPFKAWAFLSAVLGFLACDEWLSLHESLIRPMRGVVHAKGLLHFAWVVPYGLFSAIFAVSYLRFLWRLPARTRWLFVAGGAIYVGGALGCEMIGGWILERVGKDSITYVTEVFFEETMEMAGMALFLCAVLDYLAVEFPQASVRLKLAESSL